MKALASLLVLVGLCAAYVLISSSALPSTVAVHFGAGGAPNGYMSREAHVAFMLALAVLLPLLVAALARFMRRLPASLMNLPNKDYWLAPERRNQSMDWIQSQTVLYAHVLVLFASFGQWLILEANRAHPPRLDEGALFAGMAIFVALTLLWAAAFYLHFRRRT